MKTIEENKLKKNGCQICNKKYGLIPFECKCGGFFCTKHRYTDLHDCKFDHVSIEREKIRQSNPVVVQDKIANRI